jgi:hypothetical protein
VQAPGDARPAAGAWQRIDRYRQAAIRITLTVIAQGVGFARDSLWPFAPFV